MQRRRRIARNSIAALVIGLLSACAPEPPTAIIGGVVPPDSSCLVPSDSDTVLPHGSYDISPGGGGFKFCKRSYFAFLKVLSYLRSTVDIGLGRPETNVLQLNSAEVRLMNLQRAQLVFEGSDPMLPNPFQVTANSTVQPGDGETASEAVVPVEVIPAAYASGLTKLVGSKVLAEIKVFGTTTGDIDIDFKPYVFPIDICDGCLTRCEGDLAGSNVTLEDLIGDRCDDNAGADGRVCIDPDC